MTVFEAIKKYEGRVQEKQLCKTIETSKIQARNWVSLSEPPEWVDESPEWDYKDEPKKLVLENSEVEGEVFIKRRGLME